MDGEGIEPPAFLAYWLKEKVERVCVACCTSSVLDATTAVVACTFSISVYRYMRHEPFSKIQTYINNRIIQTLLCVFRLSSDS